MLLHSSIVVRYLRSFDLLLELGFSLGIDGNLTTYSKI